MFQSLRVHIFVESVFVTANMGWVVMFIMPAFTAASVQSFYAWRIYILSQNRKVFPTVIFGVSHPHQLLKYFSHTRD